MNPRSILPTLVGPLTIVALAAGVDRIGAFTDLRAALARVPEGLPNSRLAPPEEVTSGRSVLSLHVDPVDLYDRTTGILANRDEHGRIWERPATVSYYDRGGLVFAGAAGVRVHGGGSRQVSPIQSFRLHFRRRYGAGQFAAGVFGPDADPVQRIVVHNDLRLRGNRYWHLINPLAYDIARRIGCLTVDTRPAVFYLNGERQGVYVLSEHLDRGYFRSHYGHEDFFPELSEAEALWARLAAERPLTMTGVAEVIDLDNLTRWFLSILFSDTRDAYQSPNQFRDERAPGSRWFFINWDMDTSFERWDADSFRLLLERVNERRRGRRESEPRAHVITTLLAEDEDYRAYFKRTFDEVMNHRLTSGFLTERFRHYESIARAYGVPDGGYLETVDEFLRRRPARLRTLAEQHLNTDPSPRVRVSGPRGVRLEIDGHSIGESFDGRYFPGASITVRVGDADAGRLLHWSLDGRPIRTAGPAATVLVSSDVTIEAVLR